MRSVPPPLDRPEAGRPAALLLDLDGTLVDSEPLHRRGYRAFLDSRGWNVPDLSVFTGRRAEDVFAAEPGPWAGLDPHGLLAEVLTHVPDEAAVAVPGARDLVLAARAAGIRLAIVTSAGPAWVERSLVESLGLSLDAVDTVVTARDVMDGKPSEQRGPTFTGVVWADPVMPTTDDVTINTVFSRVCRGAGSE